MLKSGIKRYGLPTKLRHGARHVRCLAAASRYAVVGAGFAGLATAWNLLKTATSSQPVEVTIFDVSGIGAGGSGAAAGLLHPFSPKGKLLWKGDEAMADALELLEIAEKAAGDEQIAWRSGMIRPAANYNDAVTFLKHCSSSATHPEQQAPDQRPDGCVSTILTEQEATSMVPDLQLPPLEAPPADGQNPGGRRKQRGKTTSGLAVELPAAFFAAGGVTLQPQLYMKALWQACQALCQSAGAGTSVTLVQEEVRSLEILEQQHGSYAAVVVAAGAAAGSIQEVADAGLPVQLCQGYSLNMVAEAMQEYHGNGPSILGRTYLAVHGSSNMVVGATKKYGLQADAALQLCKDYNTDHRTPDAEAAAEGLLAEAAKVWPHVSAWKVQHIRSGVRALPQRTSAGSLPLLGKLPGSAAGRNWWLIGGLGARGLVYHAWLAKQLVNAILINDESVLTQELTAWKLQKAGA